MNGDTERLHSADCRRQEEHRRREADAMQAGFEAGKQTGIVHGYDAQFWHGSYVLLRDAVIEHLDECIRDDDVAEEAILIEAIETAGKRLRLAGDSQAQPTTEADTKGVDRQ